MFLRGGIVSVLGLTAGAVAQQTHVISVGNGNHQFQPDSITAAVNDTVRFDFYPANHSVVRSSFEYPCIPYELTQPHGMGFFSGFKPVLTIQSNPPSLSIVINDTDPIYYYCSAPGSCITWGMVGVINPSNQTIITDFIANAKAADFVLQPGEQWPSEQPPPTDAASTSSTGGSVLGVAAKQPTPASTSSTKMSNGEISGVTISAIIAVVLIGLLFFMVGRNKKRRAPLAAQENFQPLSGMPHMHISAPMPPPFYDTYPHAGYLNFSHHISGIPTSPQMQMDPSGRGSYVQSTFEPLFRSPVASPPPSALSPDTKAPAVPVEQLQMVQMPGPGFLELESPVQEPVEIYTEENIGNAALLEGDGGRVSGFNSVASA
ncbi:hypothetical protein RUND412_002471 [Rhizina undulata]